MYSKTKCSNLLEFFNIFTIQYLKTFCSNLLEFFNILTIHDFSCLNINKKKIHLITTWSAIFRPRKALQNHSIRIKLCIVLVNKIRRLLPICVGRQNLAVLVFLAGRDCQNLQISTTQKRKRKRVYAFCSESRSAKFGRLDLLKNPRLPKNFRPPHTGNKTTDFINENDTKFYVNEVVL